MLTDGLAAPQALSRGFCVGDLSRFPSFADFQAIMQSRTSVSRAQHATGGHGLAYSGASAGIATPISAPLQAGWPASYSFTPPALVFMIRLWKMKNITATGIVISTAPASFNGYC